jgi:hypothetical protein
MKLYGRPAQAAAIRSRKARGFSVFKAGNWPITSPSPAAPQQADLFDDSREAAENRRAGAADHGGPP